MDGKEKGTPQIVSVDSTILNKLLYQLIRESFPTLSEEKISQMVIQAAEIAGKAISSGIENGLVSIANRIIEQQAEIIPIEREVDNFLVYDVFCSEDCSTVRGKKTDQLFKDEFAEFLEEYAAQKNNYKLIHKTNGLRNGVAIKFENPLSEKKASNILGIEGLWILHNNTRYLIYDGNFYFSPKMIERFNSSNKYKNSFGVAVSTNLIRGKSGPLLVTTVADIEENGIIAANKDYVHHPNSSMGKKDLYLNLTRLSK